MRIDAIVMPRVLPVAVTPLVSPVVPARSIPCWTIVDVVRPIVVVDVVVVDVDVVEVVIVTPVAVAGSPVVVSVAWSVPIGTIPIVPTIPVPTIPITTSPITTSTPVTASAVDGAIVQTGECSLTAVARAIGAIASNHRWSRLGRWSVTEVRPITGATATNVSGEWLRSLATDRWTIAATATATATATARQCARKRCRPIGAT
jgi:hypothetical protein